MFSEVEIRRILGYALRTDQDSFGICRSLIIHLLFDTGIRQSELSAIRRRNFFLNMPIDRFLQQCYN